MPDYDALANYELVRDLAVEVDVFMVVGTSYVPRAPIAKDDKGYYHFTDDWRFVARDRIEKKDLTNGEVTYTLKMYDEEKKTYVAKNFDTDLAPGKWRLEAAPNNDYYIGTAYGDEIELYEAEAVGKKALQDAWIQPIPSVTYNGNPQTPTVTVKDGETTLTLDKDYTVSYANNTLPGTATVTVTAIEESNYTGSAIATFTIDDGAMTLTANGYYGNYDGEAHGITVTAPEGATVRFGVTEGVYNLTASPTYTNIGSYTVYYQVTKTNYVTVTGSQTVIINKADGSISYATTSVRKTYGDDAFTNQLTLTGDGMVSYSTSNADVANVDATTGEVTIISAGTATITATATDGRYYAYETNTATYDLTVEKATMNVTAKGYTGAYDGQPHGITVNAPADANVWYGKKEGVYDLYKMPTYTESGTYTVYYQVLKENYNTVTGSATVTINKAAGSISYAITNVEKAKGDTPFTNPVTVTGDGEVRYSTSDYTVASVNAVTGEVTIVAEGTATITAIATEGVNYIYPTNTATYKVLVGTVEEPGTEEPGEETIVINTDANEAEGDNAKVDGVKFNVSVDKNSQSRQEERTFTDPVTGETVTKTVTIVPITLESIIIPKQEGASATDKKDIAVTVPPFVVGPDGTIYEITSIAANAFVSNEPTATVTTVVLPDTEKPLVLEEGAMNTDNGDAMKVLTPLKHLDDYALNNVLAKSYQALKVSAMVTPPNRYWSFSCGVDVLVPEGVSVYTCQVNNQKEVEITQIEDILLKVDGKRTIMANNGVLIACTDGTGGNAYELVANPGRQESGTKPAEDDAKSYGLDNLLEPVIESKNYAAGEYYVLVGNKFHPILFNNSMVPACKAVLKYAGGSANARMAIVSANGTTDIDASLVNSEERIVTSDVYDLNGRQVQNPVKGGVYIINNKKVVNKK